MLSGEIFCIYTRINYPIFSLHSTNFVVFNKFRALNQAISNAVPAIVLVVTLTAYRRTGKPIVASTIFTAISLFNQLRFPLLFYPMVIDALANGKNALRRLSAYLCQEDLTPYVQNIPTCNGEGGEIDMVNGNFLWSKPIAMESDDEMSVSAVPALCGANLNVKAGEIVAVVGSVGSGKSALIKSLLGECTKLLIYYVVNRDTT